MVGSVLALVGLTALASTIIKAWQVSRKEKKES